MCNVGRRQNYSRPRTLGNETRVKRESAVLFKENLLNVKVLANEHTLLRFCSHLVDRLHHSSIKVYLSAVHSLHIYYGFPDPLVHCLQLQRLLCGIKRHQGSHLPQRQPVTADLMRVIHRSVDLQNPDHIMLWAACCIVFLGVFFEPGSLLSIPPLTHPFI